MLDRLIRRSCYASQEVYPNLRVFYFRARRRYLCINTLIRQLTAPSARRAGREWRRMTILAYRYRTDPRFAWKIDDPRRLFSGIFRRLLTDPLEELEEAISGKRDE